jgi:hypothetical protein
MFHRIFRCSINSRISTLATFQNQKRTHCALLPGTAAPIFCSG